MRNVKPRIVDGNGDEPLLSVAELGTKTFDDAHNLVSSYKLWCLITSIHDMFLHFSAIYFHYVLNFSENPICWLFQQPVHS